MQNLCAWREGQGSPELFKRPDLLEKVVGLQRLERTSNKWVLKSSSLQIEVVVLDSAGTYLSGKLAVKCCMKSLHGQFWPRYPFKDSTSPWERLVMVDIGQLLWLQEWKDGYARWSQSQDFSDFDQCILRPKDSTWDPANKKQVCSLQMVIMLKRRAAKAFAKPSDHTSKAAWSVHAIMQWRSQSVGWSGFLDGDCLDASPGANLFQLRLLEVAFELPKSNSWPRTCASRRYVSARLCGMAGCGRRWWPAHTP